MSRPIRAALLLRNKEERLNCYGYHFAANAVEKRLKLSRPFMSGFIKGRNGVSPAVTGHESEALLKLVMDWRKVKRFE